jgi:hypothetical protein
MTSSSFRILLNVPAKNRECNTSAQKHPVD